MKRMRRTGGTRSGDKRLQRLQMEVLTPEQRSEEEERTFRGGRLYSHAAAGWNLASISVPGDLRLREAADARRQNHGAVSLGDRLDSLALLETSHDCGRTETGGG